VSGDLAFASTFLGPFYDGRPHDQQRPPSVAIDDGADFTNDPRVRVHVRDLARNVFYVDLSNDGGFRTYQRRPVTATNVFDWTLASSGPERLPKTVYVRLVGMSQYGGTIFTDEIVLDERPPSILSARVEKKVKVKARDNLSGVKQLQVTRNRKRPGKWRRFASTSTAPKGRGAVFVRVRDGAKNASGWKTAR
jgi:hypothetical protein